MFVAVLLSASKSSVELYASSKINEIFHRDVGENIRLPNRNHALPYLLMLLLERRCLAACLDLAKL